MLNRLKNSLWLIVGAVVAVWAVTSLVDLVRAGPMEPWAPPGPTMKTLDQVEPRWPLGQPDVFPLVISVPGSYYLTENITGVAGENGIEIAADNVTLDLNGFTLQGGPGSLSGVAVTGGDKINISIHNGTITTWDGDGICADTPCWAADTGRYRDLIVDANGGAGIRVEQRSIIADVASTMNGGIGIAVGSESMVIDSLSWDSSSHGIVAGAQSLIRGCTVTGNAQNGISVGTNSIVVGNNLHDNGGSDPSYANIKATSNDNRIEGNSMSGSTWGIHTSGAGGGNVVIKNSSSTSATSYSFHANDTSGPIETKATPLTNPWANIDY